MKVSAGLILSEGYEGGFVLGLSPWLQDGPLLPVFSWNLRFVRVCVLFSLLIGTSVIWG